VATIGQDLTKLAKFKEDEAVLKRRYEDASRKRKQWEAQCYERMEREETDSHKTRGKLFVRSSKDFAKVEDLQEFVEWALANEPDLVTYADRRAELNSLIRARLDDSEPLPPGVGFYTRDTVSVRKA
jgi:hypothetical protein